MADLLMPPPAKEGRRPPATAAEFASWFKALADATRIQVVSLLARRGTPMSVGEIVAAVDVGQSTVSAHLKVLAEVWAETGIHVHTLIGTMIEVPRAALTAGQIASAAQFFSFGTNDLTQMGWGFSRDDVEGAFFSRYIELGIFGVSPFEAIDRDGVGRLVRIATEEGRAERPDLHLGVCGEHGGDPDSVWFFHEVGLDYVSCSPFRVPVARLEAGRAAVASGSSDTR